MDATTFIACGFRQGRKLKPLHFNTDAQACNLYSALSRLRDVEEHNNPKHTTRAGSSRTSKPLQYGSLSNTVVDRVAILA
ncbi:hypothetical protein HDE78_004221 [Rhodanobacter sp. K2T2]|uniref:hypothetical protein n=1 Tax=Rhodanobacter sp. K2T2 TaxID=2723085 RepID=UPI0015CD7168|nr:hypothetical protein [Rhodanobacter sp. K2T2]NYE31237.1 hypothetical protein [Rhodanobacter sp. K2T2]